MRATLVIALAAYLFPLMMTQTAYGAGFSTARWVGLAALLAVGIAAWTSVRRPQTEALAIGTATAVYLCLTGVSVVFADDAVFSLFRWASHAAMIIGLYLFVRETLTLGLVSRLIVGLKLALGLTLFLSVVAPAPRRYLDSEVLFKGIFGNPNTLGHMAAVTALLFMHGAIVSTTQRGRWIQSAMAVASVTLLWHAGARSSFAALVAGVCLLS